jgi:hypothetical protein
MKKSRKITSQDVVSPGLVVESKTHAGRLFRIGAASRQFCGVGYAYWYLVEAIDGGPNLHRPIPLSTIQANYHKPKQ